MLRMSPKIAEENIARAGLSDKIDVVVGPAAETLLTLTSSPPFDLVFIDADKQSYPVYFNLCESLVRKGGLIVGVLPRLPEP